MDDSLKARYVCFLSYLSGVDIKKTIRVLDQVFKRVKNPLIPSNTYQFCFQKLDDLTVKIHLILVLKNDNVLPIFVANSLGGAYVCGKIKKCA